MKNKISFLILILTIITINVFSQERTFKLNLEGKEYQAIRLFINMPETAGIEVQGQTDNYLNWTFSIPDSVYEKAREFYVVPDGAYVNNMLHFMQIVDHDTIKTSVGTFGPNDMTVEAKYSYTASTPIPIIATDDNGQKYLSSQEVLNDRYVISSNKNPELNLRMKYPLFFWFREMKENKEKTFDDYFSEYLSLIREHPNSRTFIRQVDYNNGNFRSKEEALAIFDSFSDEIKESYYGKKVYNFINNRFLSGYTFENINLPTVDGTRKEKIIADTTKYTLAIFSASWCGPCHKIIPIYKEIYKDLQSKLNLIYLTIDEPETINGWKDLIEKEQIPWRSLVLNDDDFKKRYDVESIPYSLLVAPDGSAWAINVRIEEEKQKLYDLK